MKKTRIKDSLFLVRTDSNKSNFLAPAFGVLGHHRYIFKFLMAPMFSILTVWVQFSKYFETNVDTD